MQRKKAVYEQKQPYSEKEVNLILEAAGKINGGTTVMRVVGHPLLLIELMLETGLRVSDAVKFDPARCVKSKYLWVYSFHRFLKAAPSCVTAPGLVAGRSPGGSLRRKEKATALDLLGCFYLENLIPS